MGPPHPSRRRLRRLLRMRAEQSQRSACPVVNGAGGAGLLFLSPQTRGAERREGASNKSALGEARHGPCDRPISPPGAPLRRFLISGPCFRARMEGPSALPDPGSFRRPSSAPRPAIKGSPP
jgi:hypothetical protein